MAVVNLTLAALCVRQDHNARVCLEFYRGNKWSEYLAFEPTGLQKFREPTAKFEARFNRTVDTPLERAALAFLHSLNGAYLPGDGVAEILLEVYTMSKTDGTNDLSKLDTKALLAYYNELATATGKPELKAFKEGKTKLLAKIEALQAEVKKPTAKQTEAKATSAAKAEKRLEGLADLKAKKAADAVAKKSAPAAKPAKAEKPAPKAAAKSAAKPAKTNGDKQPRGPGIGAFCMDLIVKGKTNEEVLGAVKAKFPNASTSASSVAWYRNKLKSEGKLG